MADAGTDNFEQQFTLSLRENEEQRSQEVAAALERIEQGTFGCCEECQKEIPQTRLEAVPYTTLLRQVRTQNPGRGRGKIVAMRQGSGCDDSLELDLKGNLSAALSEPIPTGLPADFCFR